MQDTRELKEYRFFAPSEMSGDDRKPSEMGADTFASGLGSGLGTGLGIAAGIIAAAWAFSKLAK